MSCWGVIEQVSAVDGHAFLLRTLASNALTPWMRAALVWLCSLSVCACSELTQPGSNERAEALPAGAERAAPPKRTDYIHAADILIAYKGALRAQNVTRDQEQARRLAEELLKRLQKGEDFARLAREYSDDPVGRLRGGELVKFGRDDHVKAFVDAAFALKPGQMSVIVETPFGYHIILRKD